MTKTGRDGTRKSDKRARCLQQLSSSPPRSPSCPSFSHLSPAPQCVSSFHPSLPHSAPTTLGAAPTATHLHGTSPPLPLAAAPTNTPPYITFTPTLAQGSPAAGTTALADTLDRWRADANAREGVGCAFTGVIGGNRWRTEWYDVYATPNGALRTDGRDPFTLLEVVLATTTTPESRLSPESGMRFRWSAWRAPVRCCHVWRSHDRLRAAERRGGRGCQLGCGCGFRGGPRQSRSTQACSTTRLQAVSSAGCPSDALVKEAEEEASLDPGLVRNRARAVGAVSYYYQTKAGWLQPEVQFVYDMRIEPGVVQLAPIDGEVESFEV